MDFFGNDIEWVQYKRVNEEMPVRLLLGKQKAYGHFFAVIEIKL